MHDETGCFLLKTKTEGIYDSIQESSPSSDCWGERKQLCSAGPIQGSPGLCGLQTPINEVAGSEHTSWS